MTSTIKNCKRSFKECAVCSALYARVNMWPHLLMCSKFSQTKSTYFNRNPHNLEFQWGWKVPPQTSQWVQLGHVNLPCWPAESCLVSKWLWYELCFIQWPYIDNRQWTFPPTKFCQNIANMKKNNMIMIILENKTSCAFLLMPLICFIATVFQNSPCDLTLLCVNFLF